MVGSEDSTYPTKLHALRRLRACHPSKNQIPKIQMRAWNLVLGSWNLVLRNRFNLNFPALGGGHAGSVGGLAHESAGRRPILDKNHPQGNFSFSSLVVGLAIVRSNTHSVHSSDAAHLLNVVCTRLLF